MRQADSERHGREELDRQLRIAKEELDNKEQQLRVALQDKGNAVLNERSKEVRRLEAQVGKLRTREEALEADLLAAQNEIVRLRFETEHSELRLQRWQRRVRELESLPLAVGKADKPEGADKSAKRKTKDEEEMERFIRRSVRRLCSCCAYCNVCALTWSVHVIRVLKRQTCEALCSLWTPPARACARI